MNPIQAIDTTVVYQQLYELYVGFKSCTDTAGALEKRLLRADSKAGLYILVAPELKYCFT